VPDLAPEAVSIIDQKGRLLARAGEAGTDGSGEVDERQVALENRLRSQVEALLEPLVGQGKVRAEVSAEIDRDAKREEARVFDPDKQVIARQISVESGDTSQETAAPPGGVTVGNQLPAANAAASSGSGDQRQANSNQTSEDTTYENSRTDTVTQRAPGALKRLSVAVMVDSGKTPLPAAQIQKLTRIVESAVGFDAERGDNVVVDSMPFAAPEATETLTDSILSKLPTSQIFTLLQLLVVAGVGLMVMKMVRGKPGAIDGGMLNAQGALAAEGAPYQPLLGEDGQPLPIDMQPSPPSLANPSHMAQIDQEIALQQVEGGIKASSLKRLGDTIAGNPAESASVIRQWMNA
jgi:flagellar M-ring protein FliF